MEQTLKNRIVAVLVADGFSDAQLLPTRMLLTDAGASTVLISASVGTRVSSEETGVCELFIDQPISNACADEYDALLVPGGVESTKTLLAHDEAKQLVQAFAAQKSPIALLGEAAQLKPDGDTAQIIMASAETEDAVQAAAQEILALFASAPPTETQKHTAS